jgi:hypothetical protein
MWNPFKLFGRLLLAGLKITGYVIACSLQAIWSLVYGQPARIADAIGEFGRAVTDAIAEVFRE